MTRATHYGTCQVCARRHKLPGGVLSLHGYTVAQGFFNGTCLGSQSLPYEVSKDLIDQSIAQARSQAAHFSQIVEGAKTLDLDGSKGWHRCYMRGLSSRTRGSVYIWKFGTFSQDGFNVSFVCEGDGTTAKTYGQMRHIIEKGRDGYVRHVRKMRVEALAYAEQQKRRADAWEYNPDALIPVEAA